MLLLGDAAHVHSPMGGPGLNLGMQDAVNLGWKLAAAVTGRAPDGLLDTYESERYPVGERVMMHSQAQLALAAPGPEVEALRSLFAELVGKPEVTKHMAGLLAGSDVRYDVGDGHRLSGQMVPDLDLDDGRRVVELLHDGRPVLIDATGGAASAVAQAWSDRVDIVAAGISDGPAAMLIRPDGYVAWAIDEFGADDAERLRVALARWFGVSQLNSVSGRPRRSAWPTAASRTGRTARRSHGRRRGTPASALGWLPRPGRRPRSCHRPEARSATAAVG